MKMYKQIINFIYSLIFLVPIVSVGQTDAILIIPQPNEISYQSGQYTVGETFTLSDNSEGLRDLLNYASATLQEDFGWMVQTIDEEKNNLDLRLVLDTKEDETAGAYRMVVNEEGIKITAASEQGLFYGLQTMRQSVKVDEDKWSIGHMEVKDAPRFGWRAFMLDEARYFKGKREVMKLLDEMARLKMNIFHWHLTDDAGWRIEIKKYPKLTEIGSKRSDSEIGTWKSGKLAGEPHSGFYTQEDIKDIVAYAAERHITIVPEFEMPGHASAAIASYTWLGTTGKPIEVPRVFGRHYDNYDITKPEVVQFIKDVLTEMFELFPSEVIHIGGDEVGYKVWEESKHVQKYMRENGINTPTDLQIGFTNDISRFIEQNGRRMMGWNEILGVNVHTDFEEKKDDAAAETELAKNVVVHFWKGGVELITQAAQQGYDIVNSSSSHTYLDYSYDNISLEKAYSFNPVPEGLETQFHKNIYGLGCQMWSEFTPTNKDVEYQTFPRIAAYAEVGWTQPQHKDFDRFLESLSGLLNTWKAKEIFYAPLKEVVRAPKQDIKSTSVHIPILPEELWWGGAVNDGFSMPYQAGFSYDMYNDNKGNQVQPLLISNKGRVIWSENSFEFTFSKNAIIIDTRGELLQKNAGSTLKEAFIYASKNYFPANGKMPDELLFSAPQYNTWIELMYDQNQKDILEYAHAIIDNGFPAGVLMIDDNWQEDYGKWNFHPDRFPNPKKMMEELHSLGFKVMLWVCPFVSPDSDVSRDLAKKNLLIKNASDAKVAAAPWINTEQPAMVYWWNGASAVLDLSNPGAEEWFKSELQHLVDEYGVDGFKLDAGDAYFYPDYLVSYKKNITPNEHSELFGKIGLDFPLNEYRAMWKMAGLPLAQRLSDKGHNWKDLQTLIPNITSQGLMGYAFTCPDMIGGGEYRSFLDSETIDQGLIVRSAQVHALMPMMQFSVAPWRILDEEHLQAVKKAVKLREKFTPYIMTLAKEAAKTGEPIVRTMEYNFPNQSFEKVKDQFMLGETILVAPVLEKQANKRLVLLPKGKWKGENNIIYKGGKTIALEVPLDTLLYFVKQ